MVFRVQIDNIGLSNEAKLSTWTRQAADLDAGRSLAVAQTIKPATVRFGRSSGAAVALEDGDASETVRWLRGRAVIDETHHGNWRANTLRHQLHYFDNALALGNPRFDTIARFHGRGRFGRSPVHRHVSAPTQISGGRSGGRETDRP